MKPRTSVGFLVMLAALVAAFGSGVASQWSQTLMLRGELESLQIDPGEAERQRADNQRLREQQVPAAKLESLRADHAALPRLRAELDALKKPAAPSAR